MPENLLNKLKELNGYLKCYGLPEATNTIDSIIKLLEENKITEDMKKKVQHELSSLCHIKYLGDIYIKEYPHKGNAWFIFLDSIKKEADKL